MNMLYFYYKGGFTMEKKTRQEIVRMLLNQNLEDDNESDLVELLVDDSVAVDVDKQELTTRNIGDRISDKITYFAGSWFFIIGFMVLLSGWIILNIFIFTNVDPYPFILLNLCLSTIAAFQAPIILMSQNRQAKKDSLRSKNDYRTDLKSELILEELHHQLVEVQANQRKILRFLEQKDDNSEK